MKNTLTVKFRWLLSYIFISVFALFICNLSFLAYKNSFKTMLAETQTAAATQVSRSIDLNMNILSQCTQALSSAALFDRNMPPRHEAMHLYQFRQQLSEISRLSVVTGIIDRFYIYFPERNVVLNSGNLLSTETAYNTWHAQGQFSFDEWKLMLSQPNRFAFFVDYVLFDNTNYQPFFFCVRGAETAEGEPYSIILLSRLSTGWAEKNDYITDNHLTIYDTNNKIVYKDRNFETDNFQLPQEGGTYTDHKTHERYIVVPIESAYTTWRYVFFVPYSSYWARMTTISRIVLATNVLGIVLCFLLAYYLTKKNYSPMQSILSLFDKKISRGQNDFTYISSNIKTLLDEKDKLETQNESLTQNVIVQRLLTGYIPQNTYSETLLSKNRITFEKAYIRVAMFKVTDYSGLFGEDDYIGDRPPIESVIFLIINVAQDTLFEHYEAYYCSIDNDVFFMIKTDDESEEDVLSALDDMQKKLADYAYIKTVVSLSHRHKSPYDLQTAYEECLAVLRHQEMFGGSGLLSAEAISGCSAHYSYTASDEAKITNAITGGDAAQAAAFIDAIFDRNLEEKISAEAATMLVYDVITALLRVSESITLPELREPILEQLALKGGIDASREHIKEAVTLLCMHFSNKAAAITISSRIQEIVKDSYQNVNLSVAEIGYKMNKAPQYISKVFKNETGETLSSYIQKYRISVAKQLLLQTNLSVKEIATNVGFTGSNVFIAAFKNLEGVTPGQFKAAGRP